jgi:cytochrome P450
VGGSTKISRRFAVAAPDEMHDQPSSPTRQVAQHAWYLLSSYWYLVIPTLLIVRFLVQRYNSPLRVYPGPFLASGTRLWKLLSVASGKTERSRINLHRKYGRVVRLGPNELAFSSPQAAKEVLAAGKGFYKNDFYSVFPPPENPDIFTEIREDVHAQKKRVAAHPYSMSAMQQLTPIVARIILKLGDKLDGHCLNQGAPFDLGDWLHFFAFDVLGEVAFSRQFGFMDAGYDVENAIKTIDDSQWYNSIVGQMPFLDLFLRRNPLLRFVPGLAIKDAHITRMAWGEVQKRKPYNSGIVHTEHKDLLSSLIKGHVANPDKFGEADIFSVVHGAMSVLFQFSF